MTLKCIIWAAVSSAHQADEDRASLPAQEADALAYAQAQNWRVIDILRVPGHSRAYIDIHEAAADMRNAGIDAFDKLMQHWKARDFDVLICRDGTRFARTQSLHAYVVERTIEIGARIYSLSERLTVDESNARMWTSMGGFAAAGEVDNLKRRIKIGKDGRALERGLSSNGKVPRSHRLIRDSQNGKIVATELNPDTAPEWQDLATLLLEGIAYSKLALEMFRRYGYGKRGKPHPLSLYGKLLYTPAFWGHLTRNHRLIKFVTWVFNDDESPPPPVLIKRHAHPAVYTGEQAATIKLELMRRSALTGKAFPVNTQPFSGMVSCARCGYRMNYNVQARPGKAGNYRRLKCSSLYRSHLTPDERCTKNNQITEAALIEQLTPFLQRYIETGGLTLTTDAADHVAALTQELHQHEHEVSLIEAQVRLLIGKQAAAVVAVSHIYDEQIAAAGIRLEALHQRQADIQLRLKNNSAPEQVAALATLKEVGLVDFWQQDSRLINQLLHALFGKLRIIVDNQRIVDIAVPLRQRGNRGA